MWDGDFGEDEKGEFCDAVGSGGWHGGVCLLRCLFGLLVWIACLVLLVGWMVVWFGGLRSAK